MTLLADSGSTKTTWVVRNHEVQTAYTTSGINPFHQSNDDIAAIISRELIADDTFPDVTEIDKVEFYGAGCTPEKSISLNDLLSHIFPQAYYITVGSDMLGAARALLGEKEGVACILGTGSNSCLYDGHDIVSNVSPMGYILGDEGSGAVLGKTFVNMLYKGTHQEMIQTFESATGLTLPAIIERVYRQPTPNRFLASLAPFILQQTTEGWVREMVTDCFRLLFRRTVSHYQRPDLACSFVGSVAFHFQELLHEAAEKEGFTIGTILKSPLFT